MRDIIISNDTIKVAISSKGAEIQSIVKNSKEYIWQGDPAFWTGRAPVLFPICGGIKDDKYVYGGKEYILPKHGFAKNIEFDVESAEKEKAVFSICSNEETRKAYPFDFKLKIIYTLDGSKLKVAYSVENLSDGEMYFSVGAHEAYACPEGIENYSVVFEKPEDLKSSILTGNELEYETVLIGENVTELPLKYEYFAVDALVFLNLKSRKVSLKNNTTNEMVELDFNGHDYFLLWTKPGAGYICLEPWCGVPDFVDSDYDITKKKGIIRLSANETCLKEHSILF